MSQMPFPFTLSEKTFSVFIPQYGKSFATERSNPNWEKIVAAANNDATAADEIIALTQPIHAVAAALAGQSTVEVRGGQLFYGDNVIEGVLAQRVLDIISAGLPADGWVKFTENCFANPWQGVRDELYRFLERGQNPITPDGCFIAYKRVNADYSSVYKGRGGEVYSPPGSIVVMPGGRDAVNQSNRAVCTSGLHVCSRDYLTSFSGARIVIVKVNPADVVAVPSGETHKMRVWRYEVVGEILEADAAIYNWAPLASGYEEHDWDVPVDEDPDSDYDNLNDEATWPAAEPDADSDLPTKFGELREQVVIPVNVAEDGTVTVADTVPGVVEEVHTVEPVVKSSTLGDITRERFTALLAEHGSQAAIARALSVSGGTVQSWKVKLFGDN